jgi:uncharacterized protein (TIGR03437 family)
MPDPDRRAGFEQGWKRRLDAPSWGSRKRDVAISAARDYWCIVLPMRAFWVLLAFSSLGLAQPYINYRGIVNVASYMAPGLPAGSLPQGGMVAIFGSKLGPAAGAQVSSFPLGTTLAGVSVTVTQQATTVNALPVYVGAGQINAIIPSNAPLGRVSVRVIYNGVTSNPSPANVVGSSFGIITVNSAGFGPGIIQNYAPVGLTVNSTQATAQPGQVEILWGTGLGPVAQDDVPPTPVTLPVKVELFVGGQAASVLYSGRSSCCSGIDQINFTVPAAAPAGCYVPVVVRVAGRVSNTATMAIDPNGAPCTDPANSLGAILRTGGRLGAALLRHEDDQVTVSGAPQSFSIESAVLSLRQEAGGVWAFNPYVSFPPVGTCTAYGIGGVFPALSDLPGIGATVKDLNGGASVSLTGPSGSVSLAQTGTSPALYAGLLATSQNLTGIPLSFFVNGASNTLAGTGGADVGAFTANIAANAAPAWANSANVATVTRSAGFTATWTNAPASANVISIIGFNVDPANNVSGGFQCLANPAAGAFTVPAVALANVPATPSGLSVVRGWITIGAAQLASPASFTASGLDKGIAVFGSSSQQTVVYQ